MKILIAIDDNSIIDDLVSVVHEHRWTRHTEFLVLHVCEPLYYDGFYADIKLFERRLEQSRVFVDQVVDVLRKIVPGAQVSGQVIEGDIKDEIIKTARSLPADLIILGSHGRGLLGRMMFGSVSAAVNSEAQCSVLTLRRPKKSQPQSVQEEATDGHAAAS